MSSQMGSICEFVAKGWRDPIPDVLPVEIRPLVSKECKSRGLSTSTALFPPKQELGYHTHEVGEAITILKGEAEVACAGRIYRLGPLDCIHVPAGIPHRVVNPSPTEPMLAHAAFGSDSPGRVFMEETFPEDRRGAPQPGDPESVRRFEPSDAYELAERTKFYDLFAGRFGSTGICGGYGEFEPGASLPCHVHQFDESITIVTGEAVCQVAGRQYKLSDYDTAFVPEGRPHRFLNHSNQVMAMIWVYGGSEPERTLVTTGLCDGSVSWEGNIQA